VVTLHRKQTEGTGYFLTIPLFVPTGISLFFLLPPVCVCAAAVFPASGDPDLFLTINGLSTLVGSSTLGGMAIDRISFGFPLCVPGFGFVPFLRVFGFAASACVLLWSGFGVP
jgi:hypothetical protein